jgi:two-component system, OmpR family, response regulator MtrA
LRETYAVDRGSLIVRRAGHDVSLPPTELRLLLVLSGSPQRLRAKIEADTSQPRYIQTVRGFTGCRVPASLRTQP